MAPLVDGSTFDDEGLFDAHQCSPVWKPDAGEAETWAPSASCPSEGLTSKVLDPVSSSSLLNVFLG